MAKQIKTATFSNGTQDVYKGTRPVTAAWAIINKATGEILNSGHSLDAAKAQKTAEGSTRYFLSRVKGAYLDGISDKPNRWASVIAYQNGRARKMGFRDWKEAYAAYQADAEIQRRKLAIEIVAI
jgi:hypothetical protein